MFSCFFFLKNGKIHLNVERPVLDLRRALLYDEGDAVGAVPGRLREVDAEEVQLALELLVPALNGQGFQTLLMAG